MLPMPAPSAAVLFRYAYFAASDAISIDIVAITLLPSLRFSPLITPLFRLLSPLCALLPSAPRHADRDRQRIHTAQTTMSNITRHAAPYAAPV